MISVHDPVRDKAFGELRRFRREFYRCLTARADAMFELADGRCLPFADGSFDAAVCISVLGFCDEPEGTKVGQNQFRLVPVPSFEFPRS